MCLADLRKLPPEITQQFEIQRDHCARMGSPLTAAICESIARHGLPHGPIFERISNWAKTDTLEGAVLALRLTGALHRLVLDSLDVRLAAQYPPNSFNQDALFKAVCGAVANHAAFIDEYLNSPPQTNEVGRSAILLPALLQLTDDYQLPFDLFELGASASLNQGLPYFSYDYDNWRWGDENSPVKLACEWRGPQPAVTNSSIEIASAVGCDIAPVEIQTEEQRKRLASYVWADQSERLSRLRRALSIAQSRPPNVEQSGAGDWLSKVLKTPAAGRHSLIIHTIMWQYMPADEQSRCETLINEFGAKASNEAPVSWLRFEADGKSPGGLLALTHWCGVEDDGKTFELARADYHGKWIEWI